MWSLANTCCCIAAAAVPFYLLFMQWYKQGARFAKWRAVLRIAGTTAAFTNAVLQSPHEPAMLQHDGEYIA
jgi:hypothetical protein